MLRALMVKVDIMKEYMSYVSREMEIQRKNQEMPD